MKTVTARQMLKLDEIAIKQYGLPSLSLMENAGRSVADVALKLTKKVKKANVLIICGAGNNAGDGLVAARHLHNAGVAVDVWTMTGPEKLKKDASIHYAVNKRSRIRMKHIKRITRLFEKKIAAYDLVVDAMFGVGLNRRIEGSYAQMIDMINGYAKKVLAVDVPSGLDATTGRIHGVAIKAHTTATLTFAKRGFVRCLGPKLCGKVKVVDIGIPRKITERI